jgi:hypothetical protein
LFFVAASWTLKGPRGGEVPTAPFERYNRSEHEAIPGSPCQEFENARWHAIFSAK